MRICFRSCFRFFSIIGWIHTSIGAWIYIDICTMQSSVDRKTGSRVGSAGMNSNSNREFSQQQCQQQQQSSQKDTQGSSRVVIPLSQDTSQRSLFSLTKVVRLGKSHTTVSFTIDDLVSVRGTLEDPRSAKHVLLQSMRRLQCYRLCLEDVRVSRLGGIVRVLSMVHPREEVREAAGRLMGRWKRIALRELFPLPRQKACVRERDGDGGKSGGSEEGDQRDGQDKHQKEEKEEKEDRLPALEDTFGYDVELARKAPDGSEVAPEELIRMEEEDAKYEKAMAKRLRVDEDPLCSSTDEDEDGTEGDSDMWSPGMDRKRRARAAALSRKKKNQSVAGEEEGCSLGSGESLEKVEEVPVVKKRLSKAFVNLFKGNKASGGAGGVVLGEGAEDKGSDGGQRISIAVDLTSKI
jgi:hypothetical protein